MPTELQSGLVEMDSQFPTKGKSLTYLPTNSKQGNRLVGMIFFPTDVPAEQGFDYQRNAAQYLSDDDETALKKLVGGEDLIENGSATDPRIGQLANVTWRFLGYADERGPPGHNARLAERRVKAVVGYLLEFIQQFDANFDSTWPLLPGESNFDQNWRWNVCANIVNGYYALSRRVGEVPSPQAEYPYYRRVEIRAANDIGYDDPKAIPRTCGGHATAESYWQWDGEDQVKKPPITVAEITQSLTRRIKRIYGQHVAGKRNGDLDMAETYNIVDSVRQAVYCYRYQRMVMHELFYGSWGPSHVVDAKSGRAGSAAADLICFGNVGCANRLLSENPFEAGSNVQDANYNMARQIEHMYTVRTDPFYRAAYIREFPGKNPKEAGAFSIPSLPGFEIKASWIADEKNILPADQWDFWPTADWANLDAAIKTHIQKREVIPAPETHYKTGKDHNRFLKGTGAYDYEEDYAFKRADVDPTNSQQWQSNNITAELEQANGGYDPAGTSHVEHVRDAIREAQTRVKNEANDLQSSNEPDMYDLYVTEWRTPQGKPDYTDSQAWSKWGEPTMP